MATYFDELEGTSSKFTKTKFDLSFREDWTKDLLLIVERLILNGYNRGTIMNALIQELGISSPNARHLYTKVESKMYKTGADKKNSMLSKNIIRLEHIYNQSMQNGNINNAIKAIDCLNKLCGLYVNNIEVQQTSFTFQLGNNEPTQLPESIEITQIEPIEVIDNNEENDVVDE